MRALLAALLACMPLAAAAQMPSAGLIDTAPAVPQITIHDDWRLSCLSSYCAVEPVYQAPPLSLRIGRDQAGQVLVLRTPLGLLLAEGASLAVDGRALGRLAFLTCEADGCVAPLRLDGDVRAALRRGRELTVSIVPRDGAPIVARYSLIGFTAATDDLAQTPATTGPAAAP